MVMRRLLLVLATCSGAAAFSTRTLRALPRRSAGLAPRMVAELPPCNIKVIGVGGGGGNAVKRMIDYGVGGVEFIVMNTDTQALVRAPQGIEALTLGTDLTGGLGAGGIPDVGRQAAEESLAEIEKMIAGADMVFVTAGMGGGTGSGAAPVVAAAAQRQGALCVGVVTRPFTFEGGQRRKQAMQSIAALKPCVDALIVIANDKLLDILPEAVPLNDALTCADDILRQGVVGISDIIVNPGLINVDFSDVRSVMSNAGTALMGIGSGNGPDRARLAAQRAVASPLLECDLVAATGAVFNIVGGPDMTLGEITAASEIIEAAMDPEANIIFGSLVDESRQPGGDITVTMIATGFDAKDGAPVGPPVEEEQASGPMGGWGIPRASTPAPAPAPAPAPRAPPRGGGDDIPDFLSKMKRRR